MVLPVGWELLRETVISGQSVDSAFHQYKPELCVLVLSILFQMLSNGNSFLDQVEEVLRDFGSQPIFLQNAQNLGPSDVVYLRDPVRIS